MELFEQIEEKYVLKKIQSISKRTQIMISNKREKLKQTEK